MVLGGEIKEESSSDTAPLSPEIYSQAHAKNKQLNESLGMQDEEEMDPSMDFDDEATVDDSTTHGFSDLELEQIAKKMQ